VESRIKYGTSYYWAFNSKGYTGNQFNEINKEISGLKEKFNDMEKVVMTKINAPFFPANWRGAWNKEIKDGENPDDSNIIKGGQYEPPSSIDTQSDSKPSCKYAYGCEFNKDESERIEEKPSEPAGIDDLVELYKPSKQKKKTKPKLHLAQ